MNKQEALKILFECAALYQKNFENQNILLLTANNSFNKIEVMELRFERTNFEHLTGVKFGDKERMPPDTFYRKCLEKRLSINDFYLSPDGTTEMKLTILPQLFRSSSLSANMVGDYKDRRPSLFSEKLAGNERACVGFVHDDGTGDYAPNTILKIDMRDIISNRKRVIATYRKDKDEARYSKLVYKAKNIPWEKVSFPKGYEYLADLLE